MVTVGRTSLPRSRGRPRIAIKSASCLAAWLPNPLSQLALERARRLEWQVRTRQTLANLSEAAARIPRTHNISRAEFLERYYSQNQPVVIEGLVNDWPARTRWSGAYLKERFPGVEVHVSANRNMAPVYEQNTGRGSRPLRLAEYVEWVESIRESNELYIVARNNNLGLPALKPLLADIVMPPALLDASRSDGCAFIWYGPAGTVTPLHHDTTNILFCQVVGRKKLKLVSPLYTQLLRRSVTYYSLFDPEKPDFEQFPETPRATDPGDSAWGRRRAVHSRRLVASRACPGYQHLGLSFQFRLAQPIRGVQSLCAAGDLGVSLAIVRGYGDACEVMGSINTQAFLAALPARNAPSGRRYRNSRPCSKRSSGRRGRRSLR